MGELKIIGSNVGSVEIADAVGPEFPVSTETFGRGRSAALDSMAVIVGVATSLGANVIGAMCKHVAEELLLRARRPVSKCELHDGDRVVMLIKPTAEALAQHLADVMKTPTNSMVIYVEHEQPSAKPGSRT